MCTIMTFDKPTYMSQQAKIRKQIAQDAKFNDDGMAIVILDPDKPGNNGILRTMNPALGLSYIEAALANCSNSGRLFIHQRMATTGHVGVAYTHAFDNLQGVVVMHNGILHNKVARSLNVDSFYFSVVPEVAMTGEELLYKLFELNESYANVFTIDTVKYNYTVTRLSTGSLYTDGLGNYSTNSVGTVCRPVEVYTGLTHPVEKNVTPDTKRELNLTNVAKPRVYSSSSASTTTKGSKRSYRYDDLDDFDFLQDDVETDSLTPSNYRDWNRKYRRTGG